MSKEIYAFSAVGSCRNKDALEKILKTMLPMIDYGDCTISGYCLTKAEVQDANVLVFLSYEQDKNYNAYPFEISAESDEGIQILVNHIINYIKSLSEKDLAAFECEPSGYEEDYEIGWELYTPDWYSDEHGIDKYTCGQTVLAVKPHFLEYGK